MGNIRHIDISALLKLLATDRIAVRGTEHTLSGSNQEQTNMLSEPSSVVTCRDFLHELFFPLCHGAFRLQNPSAEALTGMLLIDGGSDLRSYRVEPRLSGWVCSWFCLGRNGSRHVADLTVGLGSYPHVECILIN